jgi:hypothetical protein
MRKVGHYSAATAELAFEDCRVPVDNLIGAEIYPAKFLILQGTCGDKKFKGLFQQR